jgi:hypothetical protein
MLVQAPTLTSRQPFREKFYERYDSCTTVVQVLRDMGGSHVVGLTAWVPRGATPFMFLVSCTTVAHF